MLTLIAAAAASAALPPRPLRDFSDWTVGCDNGRTCQAVALQPESVPEDDPPFWTLSATRGGGSLAPPEVAVEALFAQADLAARLIADSGPTPFQFDASGALIVGGDPVLLLRTLARARALTLVDAKGKTVGRLSPRGATAALRWMDEQQLRAGTTSAVIAIGSRAAPQIGPELPGIVSPPQSTKPPRQLASSEVAAIRKRYGCGRVANEKVDAHRLDAATSLAIVPCMVHAYQASSIAVVLGESGRWRPVPLERRFADPNPDETPEWMTSPDYDPDTRSLWTDYKGRGLGDCGGSESYVWDGRRFRLAYLNAMDRCAGSRARITLWRTANQPEP